MTAGADDLRHICCPDSSAVMSAPPGSDPFLEDLFGMLALPHNSPLRHHARPPAANCGSLVRAAPIVKDGARWQFHPGADKAPLGAWRWIVAVRDGCPHPPHGWEERAHHLANATAEPIVDLAAVSVDFRRSNGTMFNVADVIGTPQLAGWTNDLRLRRDPLSWLADGCYGAALLQPVSVCAPFLRSFAEIITDDIDHGSALEEALRRAYRGPRIFVAERKAA